MASIPARMYLYLFPYRVSEGMYNRSIDASHLGLLPGNEVYRYVLELVNVLARMLVLIAIV